MWERRWCSCIKQRFWKMLRSTRETQIILTPVRPGFNPHRISVLGRNTGEIKKNFSCHLFSISLNILNWLTIVFFLNRSGQWSVVSFLAACRETHLNGIYVAVISHAVTLSLWQRLISNINININFTMSFCKVYLGYRDIVRHIYYIKSKLLGLISLI